MASLNAPFFQPYVQMERDICRQPPNVVGLIIAPPQPHLTPGKLKIQRGNGLFHANEIEYVSQHNCEKPRTPWTGVCAKKRASNPKVGLLMLFSPVFDSCSVMAWQIKLSLWRIPDDLKCLGPFRVEARV